MSATVQTPRLTRPVPEPRTARAPLPRGPGLRPAPPAPRAESPERAGALDRWLAPVDEVLRDRDGLLARIERGSDAELKALARVMLVTAAVSAGLFGASLGLYRGGWQLLFASLKLPLVILLTAALCTPALAGLRAALQGGTRVLRDFALVLSSLALGTLLLAASAPLILLAISFELDYHALVLLTVACCAAGGIAGLGLFLRGLWRAGGARRLTIAGVLLLLFAVVGSQMTWTLRPYLVRPQSAEVPVVRAIEGSLFDSVAVSLRSWAGVYHSDYAMDRDGVW